MRFDLVANRFIAQAVQEGVLTVFGGDQVRPFISVDDVATVLANACGPCIGQWKRDEISKGEPNAIITSYNRNFPQRNDGNPQTMAFMGSPEIVIAYGLAGRLSFNPLTDSLRGYHGKSFILSPPKKAPELPKKGFSENHAGYVPPAEEGESVEIVVAKDSNRIQLLDPFPPWDGRDFVELPILLKVKGKCTTDHISPAGQWLRFRGHLDRISDNMFLGAVNAFTNELGKGMNQLTREAHQLIPKIAREYKARALRWVVVGDENYGEGSSREHAAMSPRFLGGAAIVVRSFARIHESNLKKQGILPITFGDLEDYERVQETDRMSLIGLQNLAPEKEVFAILHHADGTKETIQLCHTLNEEQIAWFRAGSALNLLRQLSGSGKAETEQTRSPAA
jgi:aconitate hydratase